MSLPNQVVYIQFHPIAYMVKLNIEMSMADLIVKTARNSEIDVVQASSSAGPYPDSKSGGTRNLNLTGHDYVGGQTSHAHAGHSPTSQLDEERREDPKGITRQTEVQVYVQDSDNDSMSLEEGKHNHRMEESSNNRLERTQSRHSDGSQIPLKELNPRHVYPN